MITHGAPQSTVVDLQMTRGVGAAGESILYQSQVTRSLSCVNVFICKFMCAFMCVCVCVHISIHALEHLNFVALYMTF